MAKKIRNINLLRHQEKSVIDKFLDWAFTVGRAIVIITESVALSAFAYRFILDRQIIDLKDKIKQEQAIVKLSANNEYTFRSLQNRLLGAKTLEDASGKETMLLNQILERAQGRMSFLSVAIGDETVSMDGTVSSPGAIGSFTADLRGIPGISAVSIDNISNNTKNGALTVSIRATLTK
ncbi:MAG: hypothetical protein Q8Q49_05630 [bacterium]|nr:hypothetical protein [bacterium]